MIPLTLIVAATRKNGIGQSSRLPWRLPAEMAYFARVTSSAPEGTLNAVIMGRNTWESIPKKFRPLSNRVNIVISRNPEYQKKFADEVISEIPTVVQPSLNDALKYIASLGNNGSQNLQIHRCFIIGGARVYEEALRLTPSVKDGLNAQAERVLLTRILSPDFPDCDVFLPEFQKTGEAPDNNGWIRRAHRELQEWVGWEVPEGEQEEKGIRYEFQMWTKSESTCV